MPTLTALSFTWQQAALWLEATDIHSLCCTHRGARAAVRASSVWCERRWDPRAVPAWACASVRQLRCTGMALVEVTEHITRWPALQSVSLVQCAFSTTGLVVAACTHVTVCLELGPAPKSAVCKCRGEAHLNIALCTTADPRDVVAWAQRTANLHLTTWCNSRCMVAEMSYAEKVNKIVAGAGLAASVIAACSGVMRITGIKQWNAAYIVPLIDNTRAGATLEVGLLEYHTDWTTVEPFRSHPDHATNIAIDHALMQAQTRGARVRWGMGTHTYGEGSAVSGVEFMLKAVPNMRDWMVELRDTCTLRELWVQAYATLARLLDCRVEIRHRI